MLNIDQNVTENRGKTLGAEIHENFSNPNITQLYFDATKPVDSRLDAIEKSLALMQISLFGNDMINHEGLIVSIANLISDKKELLNQNEKLVKWLTRSTVITASSIVLLAFAMIWMHYG